MDGFETYDWERDEAPTAAERRDLFWELADYDPADWADPADDDDRCAAEAWLVTA